MLIIPIAALCIVLTPLFAIYFQQKRYCTKLLSFTQGTLSVLGDLCFKYQGKEFHLYRISNQSFRYGYGGSYPVLWSYLTMPTDDLFIGNVHSRKYKYLFKFPTHALYSQVGDLEIAIVCKNSETATKIKTFFDQTSIATDIARRLFSKNTDHLRLGAKWMVGRFGVQKKWVFEYLLLPESIYQNPETLHPALDALIELLPAISLCESPQKASLL